LGALFFVVSAVLLGGFFCEKKMPSTMTDRLQFDGLAGDGVTDDTVALQSAIDLAGETQRELSLLPGIYCVSETLQIGNGTSSDFSTINNVAVLGDGLIGAARQELYPGVNSSVVIKWIGALGGTMVSFNGPMTNSFRNIELDGNDLADHPFIDTHSVGGRLDVLVRRCRASHGRFRAYENCPLTYTSASARRIVRLTGMDPTAGVTNFAGADIGNETYSAAAPGLDIARLHFEYLEVARPDGASNACLTLRMCDNVTFGPIFLYGSSNTVGDAVAIRPPTGHALAPFYPTCIGMSDVRYKGAWTVHGTWTPNSSGDRGRGIFISRLQDGDSGEIRPDHPAISGFTYAGVPFGSMGPIYRLPAQVQVTGATTQTQVFSAPIHGYALDNNRKLRFKLSGAYVNATGATRSLAAYVDYGLEVVFNGAEPAVPVGSGAWFMDVDIAPLNESTTAQVSSAEMRFYASGSLGGAGQVQTASGPIGTAALPTVDSAVEQNLRLLVTPGHAGLVIDVHSVIVEVV